MIEVDTCFTIIPLESRSFDLRSIFYARTLDDITRATSEYSNALFLSLSEKRESEREANWQPDDRSSHIERERKKFASRIKVSFFEVNAQRQRQHY